MKKKKRTINVIRVTIWDVARGWHKQVINLIGFKYGTYYYVRCNGSGEINWDTAHVWSDTELLEKAANGTPITILK